MIARVAGVLAVALFCVSALAAAEGEGGKAKEKSFKGTLSAKAADAPAGVAAVLNTTVKNAEKKAEPKAVNLMAEGDVATQLGTLAAAGAKVIVKGIENPDGSIKVSSVEEDKGGAKEGGKKGGKHGGGDAK